ncbi:DUF1641 domain-containing protein [Achromobacter anxifer]|uniref:DUF1641 domain-containing protein n=1 Tax=Achromobacter anxifer TaxID=1287737 RepID=UPI0023F738ED|nr:DUF1641 domain-containing protein [Achromobacter anxifer]MDF8361290.1 DUF1641 domain-containing protein [Achromobacter anxifer]
MTNQEPIGPDAAAADTAHNEPAAGRRFLNSDPAMEGLTELIGKLEPLLAGRRLNKIVDLLSVVADLVDMSDAYMIEKLAKAVEESTGAAWTAGNAVRMASVQVAQMPESPSLIGLLRMARDENVRRGLALMLATAGVLGRQLAHPPLDYTAD